MNKKLLVFSALIIISLLTLFLTVDMKQFDIEQYGSAAQCQHESGMVMIPAGRFTMGAGAKYPEETPAFEKEIDSFWISRHEITNSEFKAFIDDTGYVTVSERKPDPSLYPGIQPDLLKPGSAVFVKLSEAAASASFMDWWHFVEGANWKNPLGPNSDIIGKDDFPVIHIAYQDAYEYAKWRGHRLPTEAEYEYASRGGIEGATYATGNSLTQNGKYIANTWQGLFPFSNSAEDGYEGIAPVGCYQQNDYGAYDLIGNVWEWTQSVYYPEHILSNDAINKYSETGFDPNQPGVPVGVIKGGSYLCSDDFCMRYRPAARHAQDTGLGTSHIGFRTVKDI